MINRVRTQAQGLHDPQQEQDVGGMGLVADIRGRRSHDIVQQAIQLLRKLAHRGDRSVDLPDSGDGAGLLMQIPHRFFAGECAKLGFALPEAGEYGVAMLFLPKEAEVRAKIEQLMERAVREAGQQVLGWRTVPVNSSVLGQLARSTEPFIRQLFVGRSGDMPDAHAFERTLYLIRKRAEQEAARQGWALDCASCSSRTIVYKGMLKPVQVDVYYPDILEPAVESALALVQFRAGTSPTASWAEAQPHRLLAHDGVLAALGGHLDAFQARVALMESGLFGENLQQGLSRASGVENESQLLDHLFELLVLGGRSLPHAALMVMPWGWPKDGEADPNVRAFLDYHRCLMEPWEGPGAILFTDGTLVGAMADGNGLRSARYYVTADDRIVLASEVGVVSLPPDRIVKKGRLGPGEMLLVDTAEGRLLDDGDIKRRIAGEHPYGEWLQEHLVDIGALPEADESPALDRERLERLHRLFGYTPEDMAALAAYASGAQVKVGQGSSAGSAGMYDAGSAGTAHGGWDGSAKIGTTKPGGSFETAHGGNAGLNAEFGLTGSPEVTGHGASAESQTGGQPALYSGAAGKLAWCPGAPLAVLERTPQNLYAYFHPLVAQFTHPMLDANHEAAGFSREIRLGPERDLLKPGPESCRRIRLPQPIIGNGDLAKLRGLGQDGFHSTTLPIVYPAGREHGALEQALEHLFQAADEAIAGGSTLLILTDRGVGPDAVPIPALLAVSGLHHHLLRQGTRARVSLIVESGEPRTGYHVALLLGYGAEAVNPYLALETVEAWAQKGQLGTMNGKKAAAHYLEGVMADAIKVMARVGISSVQSFRGSKRFEAVGISPSVIERYFTGTPSRIGGIDLDGIARETESRHHEAFAEEQAEGIGVPVQEPADGAATREASVSPSLPGETKADLPGATKADLPGETQADGHEATGAMAIPRTRRASVPLPAEAFAVLQSAVGDGNYQTYKEYARMVKPFAGHPFRLRSLLGFKQVRRPLTVEEVEPLDSIFQRFRLGYFPPEVVTEEILQMLRTAMDWLGNPGQAGPIGGYPGWYEPDMGGKSGAESEPDRDKQRVREIPRRILYMTPERRGITSHSLAHADEIWIGANALAASPHRDLNSLGDLTELVHDLKHANPKARIHVQLAAGAGVGAIAAGAVKAKADAIVLSSHGLRFGRWGSASPAALQTGIPWELGLAEVHQTLLYRNLRSRVTLVADGELLSGWDVVIAALLGAEQFAFVTAPLIALGCIQHAQDDGAIRFQDTSDSIEAGAQKVVNLMIHIAREVQEYMAQLGFRSMAEMIGRTDVLEQVKVEEHGKANAVDLSDLLHQPQVPDEYGTTCSIRQDHGLDDSLDGKELLYLCRPALEYQEHVHAIMPIKNVHRAVGVRVGSEVTRQVGSQALPHDTIRLHFNGSAGQSFGAFLPKGMTLSLEGDANDHVGKGLSGGKIIIFPPERSSFAAEENMIVGNGAFYGATSGEAYIRGMAGERFCVHNRGVRAVVEGVGDHGCEAMSGGTVAILGPVGRNLAAGMTGGIVYVYDPNGQLPSRLNRETVEPKAVEDEFDRNELRTLLLHHVKFTGSTLARNILDNWEDSLFNFVKIVPKGN